MNIKDYSNLRDLIEININERNKEEIYWLIGLFDGLDKDEFPLLQEQIQARLNKLNGNNLI